METGLDFSSAIRTRASHLLDKKGSLAHHGSHQRGTQFSAAPGSVHRGPWGPQADVARSVGQSRLLHRPLPRGQAGRQIQPHASASPVAVGSSGAEMGSPEASLQARNNPDELSQTQLLVSTRWHWSRSGF